MLNHWLQLIHQGGLLAAVIGFVLLIVVNFVPVLPIPLIAATLGAVFDFWPALLVAWGGATAGAILKFWIERTFLQKHALKLLSHFAMTEVILNFLEKNGFLAVLVTRLIPVFPSSIVNLAGAVARIPTRTFVWATLIGKLPTMMAFTLAGNEFKHHPWTAAALIVIYGGVVVIASFKLRAALRNRTRVRAEPSLDAGEDTPN